MIYYEQIDVDRGKTSTARAVKTEKIPLDEGINLKDLVRKMDGYSGADIKSRARNPFNRAMTRKEL